MAGIASNCQVSSRADDSCGTGNINTNAGSQDEDSALCLKLTSDHNKSDVSLQELIENELALRISANATNDTSGLSATPDLLTAPGLSATPDLSAITGLSTTPDLSVTTDLSADPDLSVQCEVSGATDKELTTNETKSISITNTITVIETSDCSETTGNECENEEMRSSDGLSKTQYELFLQIERQPAYDLGSSGKEKDYLSGSEYTDTDLLTIGSSPESEMEDETEHQLHESTAVKNYENEDKDKKDMPVKSVDEDESNVQVLTDLFPFNPPVNHSPVVNTAKIFGNSDDLCFDISTVLPPSPLNDTTDDYTMKSNDKIINTNMEKYIDLDIFTPEVEGPSIQSCSLPESSGEHCGSKINISENGASSTNDNNIKFEETSENDSSVTDDDTVHAQKELGSEVNGIEKKTGKKKKSTSEETSSTSKVKKTKKTKKYEEKENISVKLNGDHHVAYHQPIDEEDDLSNVCVRELRRSFGDLRETNQSETLLFNNTNLRTRSLADLSCLDDFFKRPIKTGILVKNVVSKFENIFLKQDSSRMLQKSSFGKFDQLSKKTVLHVRSSDSSKAQQHFNQNDVPSDGVLCKACNKNVFVMEQINAERHVWHKNCFRCKTCNKQLTVDIYSSHEGELYCKPHFRDLFKPKVIVDDEEPVKLRKPELIIRENQPIVLPPDVVRASDKPDLGLEELSNLNVKSRFEVFEKGPVEEQAGKSPVNVKRSASILSKLARFQAKGMDVGVPSDMFDGIDYEESSSSAEEENDGVTKCKTVREKPIAFNKMEDVMKTWENGQTARKEAHREERKQELHHIRSRLFMGKQGKMKEAYEQAVAESERSSAKPDLEITSDKARTIKERFERGEIIHPEDSDEEQDAKNKSRVKEDDMSVFEAGISKNSRSLFQQLDANVAKIQTTAPTTTSQNESRRTREVVTRQVSNDIVRASDPVAEVSVETADISSKFKFFETYKPPEVTRKKFRITPPREGQQKSESPEREVPKNPDVVRSEDVLDESDLKKSHTTSKMLSFFRQMEDSQEVAPEGPRPLKKFTPPPMSSSSENESEEESEEQSEASMVADDIVRASYKVEDEFLKQAQKAERAKALKEKFEHWEPEKHSNNNAINMLDGEQASIDTTRSLRARFESLKADSTTEKPHAKVNRFVENSLTGHCETCHTKVYPLEKVEAGGKMFHKNCFKCSRCLCVLRMETFTMNNGHLYCIPHFKQLFITKGNYDEAFGADEHKKKWSTLPTVVSSVKLINGSH